MYSYCQVAHVRLAARPSCPQGHLGARRRDRHLPAAGLQKPDISLLSDEFLAESARHGAPESGCGTTAEAAQWRGCRPSPPERGPSSVLRGDAGCRHSPLPGPVGRCSPGDRGADRNWPARCARPASAASSSACPTTSSPPTTPSNQRQRRAGARRRDAVRHRPELVRTVRANVTIDWTLRENVLANLRRLVKPILRKYGYPPRQAGEGHEYDDRAGGDFV